MGFRSGGQATMTEIAGGSPAARGGSYVPGGEESAQRKEVTDSAGARRARSGDPADGGGSAPSPAPAKKKPVWRRVAGGLASLALIVLIFVGGYPAALLADQQLAAGLGFKTRPSGDAPTHVIRRRIETTRRPGPGNAIAEPVMSEAHYEDALAVLRHARSVIERAPSLTTSMTEERIRDLLPMF